MTILTATLVFGGFLVGFCSGALFVAVAAGLGAKK
jgi:hypothetical protein